MATAAYPADPVDDDRRMGSEYANATSYRAQAPRPKIGARKRDDHDRQHGSNDSDFGLSDQTPD